MARVLFGILFGLAVLPIAVIIWLYNGKVPVAVTDPPFPYEEQLTHVPLSQRIDKELIQMPPVMPNEETFVAGAKVYSQHCAVCHGLPGQKETSIARGMYPRPPKLMEGKGVTDDEPGESYWKVANGIRLTGMPGFRSGLSETQTWQVSLLVANADKLPKSVQETLSKPLPLDSDNAPRAAVTK